MRKYIFIFIGGAFGAVLRFTIKNASFWNMNINFPLNTLLTNVLGCFVLGLFLTLIIKGVHISAELRLGIATGFLGAFTTFSSLCKETVQLMNAGEYISTMLYIVLSIILGFYAIYFGSILAGKINTESINQKMLNI